MASKRVRVVGAALLIAATSAAGAAARMELVSRAVRGTGSRTPAEGAYLNPPAGTALSATGRFSVFLSSSADLVPGQVDTNGGADVFFYDRRENLVTLVSHAAGAAASAANASSDEPAISRDGRFVVFTSFASDLVPGAGGTTGGSQIYLWDRLTGGISLVSHASGSPATAGNGGALGPRISDNGRFVAFISDSTDLVAGQQPAAHPSQVFLWDRSTGQTQLVSRSALSPVTGGDGMANQYALSANGRFVAFSSIASDLVPGQGGPSLAGFNVFLFDRRTGATRLVSHTSGAPTGVADGNSETLAISPDGQFVGFLSTSTDLVAGVQDENGELDVFLYDRLSGATVLVSHASASESVAGNAGALHLVVGNGGIVSYVSYATDLQAAADVNEALDVFLYEPSTRTNVLLSRSAGSPGMASYEPVISRDGSRIAFTSEANDLVPGQAEVSIMNTADVFLFDRASGTLELVSRTLDSPPTAGNDHSSVPSLDDEGRCVLFASNASDFIRDDRNGLGDVILRCTRDPEPAP